MNLPSKAPGLWKRARLPLLCMIVGSQVVMIVAIFSAANYLLAKEAENPSDAPGALLALSEVVSSFEKRLLSALPVLPTFSKEAPLVAAIIENHQDARAQQAGLTDAEVVFEMIVEGGISRFVALFRSDDLPNRIGPVRSLRLHFINILEPYTALLLHIGGNAYAYDALRLSPNLTDHDGIRFDGQTYERDERLHAPHNLFMEKEALQGTVEEFAALENKTTFPLFPTGKSTPTGGERAEKISVRYGSDVHDVQYAFDSWKETYVRSTAGAPKQSAPRTVVVLEAEVQGLGDPSMIPWTRTTGNGKLLLFRNGEVFEGFWDRKQGKSFVFLDSVKQPLPLAPGQAWIMVIPTLRAVEWE